MMPAIKVARVGCIEALHESRQVLLRRLDHEMNMVAHQTIQIDEHLKSVHPVTELLQESLEILFIPKQSISLLGPTTDHPACDMIDGAGVFNS